MKAPVELSVILTEPWLGFDTMTKVSLSPSVSEAMRVPDTAMPAVVETEPLLAVGVVLLPPPVLVVLLPPPQALRLRARAVRAKMLRAVFGQDWLYLDTIEPL